MKTLIKAKEVDLLFHEKLKKANHQRTEFFAKLLASGALMQPVVIYRIDWKNVLVDGINRMAAYRLNGHTEIPAEVHHGMSLKDATRAMVELNARSNTPAEAARAVRLLCEACGVKESPTGPVNFGRTDEFTESRIADIAGVSKQVVTNYRSLTEKLAQMSVDDGYDKATLEKLPKPFLSETHERGLIKERVAHRKADRARIVEELADYA